MVNHSEHNFDYAIVGGGLFGAAAARHLGYQGHDVLVFAPEEPQERTTHEGVFASHYDEARITRMLDADEIWSELAQASINRYQQIEIDSGINFHHIAQYLFLTHTEDDSFNSS